MAFNKLPSDELRKHKGKSFIGITTVFLCHDGKGKLLLGKRSKNARDEHGRWDPGGGGLKHGETVENGLRRELFEEYGVEPKQLDFIGYFDAFREAPDGTPTHWLAMCFAAEVNPDQVEIKEPDIIDEFGWFKLDNLPSPMHSQYDIFFKKHGAKLKNYMGIK
jgi:ADP-ribose pyrophosphatase YjhB (NUDIX family)